MYSLLGESISVHLLLLLEFTAQQNFIYKEKLSCTLALQADTSQIHMGHNSNTNTPLIAAQFTFTLDKFIGVS